VTRVRVGIVSWNTASLLDRCLTALPAALDGVDASIVVVDNASSDGSPDIASGHGVRVIANDENVGYARGMNQALTGTDADALVALNPDTEPSRGSLAKLVRRLVAEPDIGLVVPRLANSDGTLQHSVYRFPSPRQAATVLLTPRPILRGGTGARWWADGYAPHDRATDIDWAVGAVHVIRAEALAGEAPYDERWFMYVEDVDLCWRLASRGWRRRLEPDIQIVHVGNAAGAQAWGPTRTHRWMAASYDWYRRTFGPAAMRRWAAVNTAAVGMQLAGAVPGALLGSRRRRARVRELADALPRQLGALVSGSYAYGNGLEVCPS
jgi:N-acetylglucosaminyl-diphospho-decaprenol L-rhamnosyltransferase